MKTRTAFALALVAIAAGALAAPAARMPRAGAAPSVAPQSNAAAHAVAPPSNAAAHIYPRDQEIALALSAAPAELRAQAGVYALGPRGFVKVRDTHNGFTCIVNRDGPRNEKPTCYDPVGTRFILPVDLRTGELLLKGVSIQAISESILDGFRSGRYHVANQPGVAYMLSHHNQEYDPATGRTAIFPAHVMFYAPYLTNKDIGSKGDFALGLPSIGYRGPMGFMIVPCGDYCGTPLKQSM